MWSLPRVAVAAVCWCVLTASVATADVPGSSDHPAVSRYPGAEIAWYEVQNFAAYQIPTGPVTGYRQIGEWENVAGRVTRLFYTLDSGRTHAEVYANYRDALTGAGFELIAQGLDPAGRNDIGSRKWLLIYYLNNPAPGNTPTSMLTSGTASQGGAGALFGRKVRDHDTLYALVSLEQHSADTVAILVDVVETKNAETGLVTANAEAIGRDIETRGRSVLEGLFFDTDKATLKAESAPALAEIARFLEQAGGAYYVVGHTDAVGRFDYNRHLSQERAEAVRAALIAEHGIEAGRLEAHGVGPLVPVARNATDGGKAQNRRVELVER